MPEPKEPPIQRDPALLWGPFRVELELVLAALRARGFDPVYFETARTQERQDWLWGYGRTHHLGKAVVTKVRRSRHLARKAADVISRARRWKHPPFFAALRAEVAKHPKLRMLRFEDCHVEWHG